MNRMNCPGILAGVCPLRPRMRPAMNPEGSPSRRTVLRRFPVQPRSTPVAFKLTNNLNGLAGAGAAMNIEVTLPGGGVTTQFGGQILSGIAVNGTTALVNPVDLSTAAAGTYTAVAKWPAASDFYGKGYDSNAVTFEVVIPQLTLSANKETVVRSNSFTVTVTGEAKKNYRLFVRDIGGLAPERYPVVTPGQNGVVSTHSPTDITILTTAAGTRSIQFDTNQSTGDWIFTICVEDPASPGIYNEVRVRVERGDVTITASGTGVYCIGEEVVFSGTCTDGGTTYLFLNVMDIPSVTDLLRIVRCARGYASLNRPSFGR